MNQLGAAITVDDLPAGTVIGERQKVEIEHSMTIDPFGINYLAHALGDVNTKFIVKELFPGKFARRVGSEVVVNKDDQKEFTNLLAGFAKDARELASIVDEGVSRVAGVARDNGTAYLIVEKPEGLSLEEAVKRHSIRLQGEELVDFLTAMLKTVHSIHERGLIHREINPSNIFFSPETRKPVLLAGFSVFSEGDSRHSRAVSSIMAKHDSFAAFEMSQIGEPHTPAADVYSLAATAYFAATGKPPIGNAKRISEIAMGNEDPYVPLSGRKLGVEPVYQMTIDLALGLFSKERIFSTTEWLRHISMVTGEHKDLLSNMKASERTYDNSFMSKLVRRVRTRFAS